MTEKERELAEAHNEIKALKLTERAKEKALDEVTEELEKVIEKFQASEAALENKNLEIKKITDEKKAALAAQFAAEATLRRVHAAQKDEDLPPLEAILAPLEAEIKLLRQEISKLQDDNRALDRLTKSKEAALLEAEREVHLAKVKASMVDDFQNRNQEVMKQIEISQEEYKILDRMHRQKVAEVEKLGQTVRELEEALLSGAAAANAVRDYQRQVNELMGEKKILQRTLSRAKVTENRVAAIVANEWKDASDKLMPVKQWLEERRFLMGEMQQLRDKLLTAERTAKTEAQLKEKFQLRLKVIEDGLKSSLLLGSRSLEQRSTYNGTPRRQSIGGTEISSRLVSTKKTTVSLARSLTLSSTSSTIMRFAKGASKSFDAGRSLDEDQCSLKSSGGVSDSNCMRDEIDGFSSSSASVDTDKACIEGKQSDTEDTIPDDFVSGIFYDMLQKEVISLRKACNEKDQTLKDRDSAIEMLNVTLIQMLSKKVETLSKAMEVEAKKTRRERAAMEKEVASLRIDKEHEQKMRRLPSSKGLSMPSASRLQRHAEMTAMSQETPPIKFKKLLRLEDLEYPEVEASSRGNCALQLHADRIMLRNSNIRLRLAGRGKTLVKVPRTKESRDKKTPRFKCDAKHGEGVDPRGALLEICGEGVASGRLGAYNPSLRGLGADPDFGKRRSLDALWSSLMVLKATKEYHSLVGRKNEKLVEKLSDLGIPNPGRLTTISILTVVASGFLVAELVKTQGEADPKAREKKRGGGSPSEEDKAKKKRKRQLAKGARAKIIDNSPQKSIGRDEARSESANSGDAEAWTRSSRIDETIPTRQVVRRSLGEGPSCQLTEETTGAAERRTIDRATNGEEGARKSPTKEEV
ncbi:hypothetical protein ACLOJK_022210 [Asimina triloba]